MNADHNWHQQINVHIGEVKLGSGAKTLNTLLGSCVGIGFLWHHHNLYGLAHCLLSKSDDRKFVIGARFIDQAVLSLIHMMSVAKHNYSELEVIVAGGGNMTMPENSDPQKLVGSINAQYALSHLSNQKIPIAYQDIGGLLGRKMMINCETGKYEIKHIPRNKLDA